MGSPATTTVGPFTAGMNNRTRDHAVPRDAFRDAVNVDLPNSGQPRRRRGTTLVQGFDRAHSLFAAANATTGLLVVDGTLCSVQTNGVTTPLVPNLSVSAPMAYVEVPGRGIAYSNGQVIGRIVAGAARPFGIAQAADIPLLMVSADGALEAGSYEVAVSYVDDLGEESGTVQTQRVDVPDNGRITVLLPRAVDPYAVTTRIYASVKNGGQDYLMASVPVATPTFEIAVASSRGLRLTDRLFTVPLPPGDVLAQHHGRTYSHVGGGLVAFTQPWSGQFNPAGDYLRFPEPVTVIAPTPGGVFFVADRTYWMAGETPAQSSMRAVANARGTRGTLARDHDSTEVMWFTPQGLCVGREDGSVAFPQQKNVEVRPSANGAALYRESDGIRQYLVGARDPGGSVAGARSYFTVRMGTRETRNEL